MKYCEEYAALLSAFADGEVEAQEREEILAHLGACDDCREYLAEIMAMKDELAASVPELPENFVHQVMWRVRGEKTKKTKKSRRTITAVASAAACLALVLLLPRVINGGVAMDSAAESVGVLTDEMASDDALIFETDDSVADGGSYDADNDCCTPAGGKTNSGKGVDVSAQQMEEWLAQNETVTFRQEEMAEDTVYYLDYEQYESFRAFMEEQGVVLDAIGEDEVIAVYTDNTQ